MGMVMYKEWASEFIYKRHTVDLLKLRMNNNLRQIDKTSIKDGLICVKDIIDID